MEGLDPRAKLFLIAFGVFACALLFLLIYSPYRRRKGFAAFAKEQGFAYYREDNNLLERDFERFRLFPVGQNRRVSNVLKGEIESAMVWLLDYSYHTGSTHSTLHQYSVCVFRSPNLKLPHFYLTSPVGIDRVGSFIAEKILSQRSHKIDFPEDKIFSQKFQVQGANESEIRPLFDYYLRYNLLRFADPFLKIEGHQDTLLFSKGVLVLPKDAPEIIKQVSELFTLFSNR